MSYLFIRNNGINLLITATSNCNYSCFTDCRSNTSYQNSIGRQFPGLLKTQFRQMIACISCINSLI